MTRTHVPPTTVGAGSLDDARWNRLHTLAVVCTLGGTALDGYILGVVGPALNVATTELHYTPLSEGLIGASALIGIFIGSLVFGRAADRWGRKSVFRFNLIAFVVLSLLQLVTVGVWDLAVYRILLGVAIGVEYAVGAALLSEFVPARFRAALLATLQTTWFVGFVGASFVGLAWAGTNWRWVLASSAIPAVLVLLARTGLPESPRWLVSQGRTEEARGIVDRHFPAGTALPVVEAPRADQPQVTLFSRANRRNAIYAGIFWACQVAPLFAIFTFITPVLDGLRIPGGFTRDMLVNVLEVLGAIVFIWVVARTRRRFLTISTFAVMGAALLVVGLFGAAPAALLGVVIAIYLFVSSGASNLQFVYPSEMFETSVRASGVGFAASISRVGAAIATYLMPLAIAALGSGTALLLLVAFPLVGLIASIAWAPETSGKELA